MARGKRTVPAQLDINEEIQLQGTLSLLNSTSSNPVVSELKRQFFDWLRDHSTASFDALTQEFAMFKIEQRREEGEDGK